MSTASAINSTPDSQLDAETLAELNCLREAVAEALERKRRLGQYSAQWKAEEGLQLIGPDAPFTEEGDSIAKSRLI